LGKMLPYQWLQDLMDHAAKTRLQLVTDRQTHTGKKALHTLGKMLPKAARLHAHDARTRRQSVTDTHRQESKAYVTFAAAGLRWPMVG